MKLKLSIILFFIYCSSAWSIPMAGTPTLNKSILNEGVYNSTIADLNLAGQIHIELLTHPNDVPPFLRSGTCKNSIASRSRAIIQVTAPVVDGIKIIFFVSASGLSKDAMLCEASEPSS